MVPTWQPLSLLAPVNLFFSLLPGSATEISIKSNWELSIVMWLLLLVDDQNNNKYC